MKIKDVVSAAKTHKISFAIGVLTGTGSIVMIIFGIIFIVKGASQPPKPQSEKKKSDTDNVAIGVFLMIFGVIVLIFATAFIYGVTNASTEPLPISIFKHRKQNNA